MKPIVPENWNGRVPPEIPAEWNRITERIIGCAMEVHTTLGPGLLERLYEDALEYELCAAGLIVHRQHPIDLVYKDIVLSGQRVDLLVDDLVIVEIKAVENVCDAHLAQLVSYLKSSRIPLGLLINFHALRLKDGLYRRLDPRSVAARLTPADTAQSHRELANASDSGPVDSPLRPSAPL